MGLFSFGKKKAKIEGKEEKSNILLAMPMFVNNENYELQKIIDHLTQHWGLSVTECTGDNQTATFLINGILVAIANMPAPIPEEDLKHTAQYTYLWKDVLKECSTHTNHAIVTLLSSDHSAEDRYTIFTMVMASLLATSTSIGVYQGAQTLLLPKPLYLDFADFLKEDQLPIALWVYIGFRVYDHDKNSIYTYGMSGFGKMEMEIIESDMKRSELHDFMLQICSYIIGSDVTLKDSETIGFSEEQRIRITESKGVCLEGNSLKLKV